MEYCIVVRVENLDKLDNYEIINSLRSLAAGVMSFFSVGRMMRFVSNDSIALLPSVSKQANINI